MYTLVLYTYVNETHKCYIYMAYIYMSSFVHARVSRTFHGWDVYRA